MRVFVFMYLVCGNKKVWSRQGHHWLCSKEQILAKIVWPISIIVWVLTWRDYTSIATGTEAMLTSTIRWWQHSLAVVTGQLIPTHNSFPQNRILHAIWTTQLARQLNGKLVINNTDYTSLTTVWARLVLFQDCEISDDTFSIINYDRCRSYWSY